MTYNNQSSHIPPIPSPHVALKTTFHDRQRGGKKGRQKDRTTERQNGKKTERQKHKKKQKDRKITRQKMMNRTQKTSR